MVGPSPDPAYSENFSAPGLPISLLCRDLESENLLLVSSFEVLLGLSLDDVVIFSFDIYIFFSFIYLYLSFSMM